MSWLRKAAEIPAGSWTKWVVASGSTVIVALLVLSLAEVNSTKSLGPVLAIGIAVGMFSMLTLLPALLVTFPRGVFWPYRPGYGSAEPTARRPWARTAGSSRPGRAGSG
jgi:putative drug exporter of the RND superfamily